MGKRLARIYSIFGQIEGVVAERMIKEGKLKKIPVEMIPPGEMYGAGGAKAQFAVVVPPQYSAEFQQRIELLYA